MRNPSAILFTQSIYMFLTSVWPLVHLNSFMLVTGSKTDTWLVKAFSLVLLSISISFFYALSKKSIGPPVAVMAFTNALVLLAVDFYYPLRGTISDIYMLDGVLQLAFIVWWIVFFIRPRQGS